MDGQQQQPGFSPSPYGPGPSNPYGQPQAPNPGHNPYGPAGQAPNPYAAPINDGAPSWQMGMDGHGVLASRGSRFAGSLLDSLFYAIVVIPVMFLTMDLGSMAGTTPDTLDIYTKLGLPILLVASVQWYLVATTGQTLAKKMLGMKIIKTTGEDVNFVSGVVMRSWIPGAIGWIPLVGGLFGLVNPLFIFGDEHQCLHDKIAGTKVISL